RNAPAAGGRASGGVAGGGVRAVRGALPLRPRGRGAEPSAGRRRDPRVPRGAPPLAAPPALRVGDDRGRLVSSRSGRDSRSPPRRPIRLEAQDTALSRRRSPVRIQYAVPISPFLSRSELRSGFFVDRRVWSLSGTLIVAGSGERPGRGLLVHPQLGRRSSRWTLVRRIERPAAEDRV